MKSNLDKWIKDAKDDVPDSGEYRRLNRAMLKERMASTAPGRRRFPRVLLGAFSLVFLMMFSGQLNQLGSDSFDMTKRTEIHSWRGDSSTIYENVFRGSSFNVPKDYSQADIDEFQQSLAAGEGSIYMVTGLSYGGRTSWDKHVIRIINGKETRSGGAANSPPSQYPENHLEFIEANIRDLVGKCKNEPPHEKMKMMVDGVLIDFGVWTFEYPGYGDVTYYKGYPVEQ